MDYLCTTHSFIQQMLGKLYFVAGTGQTMAMKCGRDRVQTVGELLNMVRALFFILRVRSREWESGGGNGCEGLV